jgi:hypothetical protein
MTASGTMRASSPTERYRHLITMIFFKQSEQIKAIFPNSCCSDYQKNPISSHKTPISFCKNSNILSRSSNILSRPMSFRTPMSFRAPQCRFAKTQILFRTPPISFRTPQISFRKKIQYHSAKNSISFCKTPDILLQKNSSTLVGDDALIVPKKIMCCTQNSRA